MSLEAADFIKALIQTNPEGTDPKSQGDDHLRLIKHVLLTQFAGLTEGIPLTFTETEVNAMCGFGSNDASINIDQIFTYHFIKGVNVGMAGNFPPGWAPGDVIVQFCYNNPVLYQLYFLQGGLVYNRMRGAGGWGTWTCLNPAGIRQTWQGVTRVTGTTYTNTTGRPITVSACINGPAGTAQSYLSSVVGAVQVAQVMTSDTNSLGNWTPTFGNTSFVVPDGNSYSITTTPGGGTVAFWRELR